MGANLAKSIGPATSKPIDGLKKFPREKDSIFLYSITEDEMSNIINSLPNKSSSGVDDTSNKILKHLKNELVTPLLLSLTNQLKKVYSLQGLNLHKLYHYIKERNASYLTTLD